MLTVFESPPLDIPGSGAYAKSQCADANVFMRGRQFRSLFIKMPRGAHNRRKIPLTG